MNAERTRTVARQSVQDVWDRFGRWATRYRRVCTETVAEIGGRGQAGPDETLFFCTRNELNLEFGLDFELSQQELCDRVDGKIRFLQGYLRDIMYDGAEFTLTFLSIDTFSLDLQRVVSIGNPVK